MFRERESREAGSEALGLAGKVRCLFFGWHFLRLIDALRKLPE